MIVAESTRKNRRKQTAEVFTPESLVEEMLSHLPQETWTDETKTFCDPAAGNGNFLVKIYEWKVEKYHHDPKQALSTLYGVELMQDNTEEMKHRLLTLATSYGVIESEAKKILDKNIVCHDALTYDWEFRDPEAPPRSEFISAFGKVS